MATPIANNFSIMDAPQKDLVKICLTFIERFDNYRQQADDQGRPELAADLGVKIEYLDDLIRQIKQGRELTPAERNNLRMTIKFTEKLVASELFFPKG